MKEALSGPSRVVTPRPLKWHQKAVALLAWLIIHALTCTVRLPRQVPEGLRVLPPNEPVIFALWHNRLAMVFRLHEYFVRRLGRPRRLAAMVSASRDGGILSRILEYAGIQPVRGSTSRRGPQALLEMTKWAKRKYDLSITPDGPRGPSYRVHPGVISLAQATGLPVVPVSYVMAWKLRLRSWDRFQVPLPFSVCTLRVGERIYVPREATEAEREELRLALESRMCALSED